MPLVSVILPVYNVEQYLGECLESVLRQTLRDIEIICIDDGSTDNSLKILKEYANKDKRIKILEQENKGAGVARNYGMSIANGKYLSFLDSDDFFHNRLLEIAVHKAEEEGADIVIYKYKQYDQKTKKFDDGNSGYNECLSTMNVFSYVDIKDNIFSLTNPAAWNKIYKREFVVINNLEFQDNKRTNDLFFTHAALVCAQKIALLDKVLVYYRVGMASNSQSTNNLAPLDFYKALKRLKDFLDAKELFVCLKKSFFDLVVAICRHNIRSHNYKNRCYLYKTLRSMGYEELELDATTIDRIERAKWHRLRNLFNL